MFIEPQVTLDRSVLETHLAEVRAEKAEALLVVEGIDKSVFSSQAKFVALLESYGVEVPYKISLATGEEIPALARGDWAFKELCADDKQPPIVQALLATRMSVKSTIDETRAERLLKLSTLCERAPVPLKYSGARTHRFSGDGKANWQNIRRGSTLRKAIQAPPGYRIVHRDSSQIEARMVAWMASSPTLLEAFTQERDVYSEFASTVYGRPVTRADTLERFVGKTSILGLGYSCGAARFRHMLYIGNGGVSMRVDLDEAQRIVNTYRNAYPEIVTLWHECDILLDRMIEQPKRTRNSRNPKFISHIPIHTEIDRIWLPSGLCLRYPKLRHYCSDEDMMRVETHYDDAYQQERKLYGAKVVENLSQALARIVITDIAVRVYKCYGNSPWLSTHDSLDYVVPESEAQNMNTELEREFSVVPRWAEGLPLASEGGWGVNLFDAERGVNQ
jgi:DNA polymerase